MYMKKEYPTVKKILNELLNHVEDFPNVSEYVIRQYLKKMNFKFKKFNKKPILMESWTIAGKRAQYLLQINNFRNNGYKIYYTDETWCGANHCKNHGWMEDITKNRSIDNYDHYRSGIQEANGFRGGFITPSGAGKRVIILHIGSEDGFLEGGMNCFIGNKNSSDYHQEMNAMHYEEWFRKILTLLPTKSVIVLDQAPYHTMLDPEFRNPTKVWRKQNIIEWMQKRNIPLPEGITSFEELTIPHLRTLCTPYLHEKKYLLEKICKSMRHEEVKLLWLPVAHCELNPIELVWAYVKNRVAEKNKTFKVKDVHTLCLEVMNTVPCDLWANCVRHVIQLENEYRGSATTISNNIESIIINTQSDSGESDSDESDSDSDEGI